MILSLSGLFLEWDILYSFHVFIYDSRLSSHFFSNIIYTLKWPLLYLASCTAISVDVMSTLSSISSNQIISFCQDIET